MDEKVERLSMSLEKGLLDKFERLVAKRGYKNRSEFIRDLIRDALVNEQWEECKEVIGTITIVYDHHRMDTGEQLTELQHKMRKCVMASTHIHLTDALCAEMIMLRGNPKDLQKLADAMRSNKGVFHAALSLSSTGKELE